MNLAALIQFWPAVVAGIVGASIPRQAKVRHRLGLACVAAFAVLTVMWLWPDADGAKEATEKAAGEWPYLLDVLVGLPIFGAVVLLFLPRQMLSTLRAFTYGIFGVSFLASLWLLRVPMTEGWHFVHTKDWIPSAGIRWHVAVDGMSVWLVVLTTFTTPIAAFASFGSVKTRVKELCVSFLLMQGAMLGAFVALDMFQFYVFWELMLVPMFLMIGIWGGVEKIKASVKFFLFTMAGSVLMLAALLYLVWTHHELTGVWSWDYLDLVRVVLRGDSSLSFHPQMLGFLGLSLAFFIKVPMFPFHTWLPDAHVQAPTGGSVVLAAIMLKLGTYAYMRFSMQLFPGPAHSMAATLAGVAIMGGIIYGAFCAWKQGDIKRLVAYSSVAHLGFVMLGLFGATTGGMQGAILQMVNHGIATGALFMLVGVIYDRRHTRELSEFGGLAKVMPVYATLFIIVTMASIGVPGTNGFVGEFMIIAGTFVSEPLSQLAGLQAFGAALGVIFAAVYMLGAVQKMFFGPLTNPKNKHLSDISPREAVALSPFIVMIFVIGLFPSLFLDRMKPAVDMHRELFKESGGQALRFAKRADGSLLDESHFPPAFLAGSLVKDLAARAAADKAQAVDTAPAPSPAPAPTPAPTPNVQRLPAPTAAPATASASAAAPPAGASGSAVAAPPTASAAVAPGGPGKAPGQPPPPPAIPKAPPAAPKAPPAPPGGAP
ncbi:MAG: NADH-quinone oxidoreductase subunit M [Myxococcales bacterium]|nr:NADH-quinone oxidoreductase subunit M [Myxococcales bacterium]